MSLIESQETVIIHNEKAIFLSYSSDDTDAALRICKALRDKGLEVWFDQSELRSGDAWDASIRKQIKECALFVPIISASTQVREEGYFRLEWKLSIDRSYLMADDKAFLFPVVIDDIPEQQARVPDRFRERQWTRLRDDKDLAVFAERLKLSLSGNPAAVANPTSQTAKKPSHDKTGFWVGVPAFKHLQSNPDLVALAEGMVEDIVTGLSRFSYLLVAGGPHVGRKDLKTRYLMDGSLRLAGSRLRVAVQLVDTETGTHLWAETYDRTFSPEAVFDLQDELVPRIVSTIADMNGVLPESMSETVRHKPPEQLSPYEAVLRSFVYFWRLTAEEFEAGRTGLERAVKEEPAYADAWAMLALLLAQAHGQRFNPEIDFLSEAESAARQAIAASPTNHMGWFGLAQALFFQREYESLRNAAFKAAELNPMDGNTIAFLGELLSYSGEWEEGQKFSRRAKQLNPNHPGWYWITDYYHAYRQNDYRGALSCALKINIPGHWGSKLMLGAAYGQLGETEPGYKALRELEAMKPNFAQSVRNDLEQWFTPEYTDHLLDGLRKCGWKV
ncbi:MAG: TIR domain-containing protein [Xanthomonadales bacterium]|nr:TIR domain-containing protein [Xanthomonadales bacterium]MDH3939823.1 TIR domain-containing protein [Xanthomonadales bacterium]MDH4001790.1 TIR domain-containing protein [Xanthomonadales bacterium]